MDLQTLADRLEINDLLTTYATSVDDKDWTAYRNVFTPDAFIDYESAGGVKGSVDEVVAWMQETMAGFPMTQHLVANVKVQLDGDTAKVRAMFYNPMQLPGMAEQSCCGGYYHHELVRTSDGWRSRSLREDNVWFTNPP
jgi:3-phenylpropionate/cinnamic acid dioxygenase small subunit